MKIKLLNYIIVFFVLVSFVSCGKEKKSEGIKSPDVKKVSDIQKTSDVKKVSDAKIQVLKQSKTKRIFRDDLMVLVKEIPFKDLKSEIFRPTEVNFDSDKNIYIFDSAETKIHKLYNKGNFSGFTQSVFKNRSLKGQGPGEVGRLADFKVYKKRVYLLDGISNSLIVYSDNGELIKTFKHMSVGSVMFQKFTFLNDNPLMCAYRKEDIFFLLGDEGKVKSSFGRYIYNKYPDNVLYHQYYVSKPVNGRYYYFPLSLGIAGSYNANKLEYAKETIDGRQFPEFKKIGNATMLKSTLWTVYKYAVNKDLLLIKSFDIKKKTKNWDFYKFDNFDYIFSVKNPPKSSSFDIKDNYLVSVSEDGVKIYDISPIIKMIKGVE